MATRVSTRPRKKRRFPDEEYYLYDDLEEVDAKAEPVSPAAAPATSSTAAQTKSTKSAKTDTTTVPTPVKAPPPVKKGGPNKGAPRKSSLPAAGKPSSEEAATAETHSAKGQDQEIDTASQWLKVSNTNHGEIFQHAIQCFRDSIETDVTLMVEGKPIAFHSSILAAVSELFRSALQINCDCEDTIVIMDGFKYEEIQRLESYCYSGMALMSGEEIEQFASVLKELAIYSTASAKPIADDSEPEVALFSAVEEEEEEDVAEVSVQALPKVAKAVAETLALEKRAKTELSRKLNPTPGFGMSTRLRLGGAKEDFSDLMLPPEKIKERMDPKYCCDQCGKAFQSSFYLKQHQLIHTGERPYVCDICNRAFRQVSHLRVHKRTHSSEKPFECDICHRRYAHVGTLNEHKLLHTGKAPYQCEICQQSYWHMTSLRVHHCQEKGTPRHACDVCGRSFGNAGALGFHKQQMHEPGEGSDAGKWTERHYACDVCNEMFSSEELLATHRATHDEDSVRMKCLICGERFNNRKAFRDHRAAHVNATRATRQQLTCNVCYKEFAYANSLKRHLKKGHGEISEHTCTVCKKDFRKLSAFRAHMEEHKEAGDFFEYVQAEENEEEPGDDEESQGDKDDVAQKALDAQLVTIAQNASVGMEVDPMSIEVIVEYDN